MAVSWITYKGRRILYSDYRNIKDEEGMLENLKLEEQFYKSTNLQILALNDYRDAYVSSKFMNEIKALGKELKGRTSKAAILGISGAKRILLNGYSAVTGEAIKAFDTEDKAKDYLVD